MADKIKFLKTREVKTPSRAYDFDAGIDLYVPRFDAKFVKDLKEKNSSLFNKCCDCNSYGTLILSGTYGTVTNMGTASPKVEYDLNDDNDTIIKFDDKTGLNYFLLAPGSRVNIPSGIKVRMAEPGRAFIAFNKSGVASKLGLVAGACVVDYLYQGEIHLNVINTSTKVVRIYEDMKLLQFIEMPVFNSQIEITEPIDGVYPIMPNDFYKGISNDRGAGGFGSSDEFGSSDGSDQLLECGCEDQPLKAIQKDGEYNTQQNV